MRACVFVYIVCFAALPLLAGCVPVSQHYKGKFVSQQDVIVLHQGKSNDKEWKTFDVELSFYYELDGDQLILSGSGQLGPHYRSLYTHISNFYVYLFFVDSEGQVLEAALLPTHAMSRPDDTFTINKRFVLPPEASGLAFGYQGDVYEREDSESSILPIFNHGYFSRTPH